MIAGWLGVVDTEVLLLLFGRFKKYFYIFIIIWTLCTWLWMSDCGFTQHSMFFEYPSMWCAYSTVWLWPGWYCVKMLSSQRRFCVHHTAMFQFTVSFYSKWHTLSVCVFSCNLPPALSAQWPEYFTCCCGKIYPLLLLGFEPCDHLITSLVLCNWAIPTPQMGYNVHFTNQEMHTYTDCMCHVCIQDNVCMYMLLPWLFECVTSSQTF